VYLVTAASHANLLAKILFAQILWHCGKWGSYSSKL